MADNVTLEAVGTPGAVAATDEIAAVHYQRVKVNFGADGAATDVSSSAPLPVDVGTGATGAAKVEDAAAASADVGIPTLTVRQDTIAGSTSTDGDYQHAKSDSVGRLYVNASGVAVPVTDNSGSLTVDAPAGTPVFVRLSDGAAAITALPITDNGANLSIDDGGNSITVDGAVSATVTGTVTANLGTVGTAATDLAKAEDVASASGDVGIQCLTVRQDTLASSSSTDGDYQPIKTTAAGRVYASATIDAAIPAGANIIGALSANQSTNVAQLAGTTADTNSGNKSAGTLRVVLATDQPALTNKLLVTPDANSAVNVAQINGVTVLMGNGASGTGAQRVTIANDSTGQIIALGAAAHDAAIAGAPVRTAGRARTSSYTAVANDDTADLISTLDGKQVVQLNSIPENSWNSAAASGGIVNTTGVTAKASAGAGVRNYITHVDVVNGHATVDTDVQIRDGASGTVLWRSFAKAAGGGVSANFDPPLRGTAATLVEIACGTTGTATYFNLAGYVGP